MTRVQRLEKEIEELSAAELEDFRTWFQEVDAADWDRQIEADAFAGKFDRLAEKALEHHNSRR
jgi:hypothetical protein